MSQKQFVEKLNKLRVPHKAYLQGSGNFGIPALIQADSKFYIKFLKKLTGHKFDVFGVAGILMEILDSTNEEQSSKEITQRLRECISQFVGKPPKQEFAKLPLHAELQKFPKKQWEQDSFWDKLTPNAQSQMAEKDINTVGLNLSKAENKALFAVMKISSRTGFASTTLKVLTTEYLEAYGVGKKQTTRNKVEFNRGERDEAMKAMDSLNDRQHFLWYEKMHFNKGEAKVDVVTTFRSLINLTKLHKDMTLPERDALVSGDSSSATQERLTHLQIELAPILVDQIHTYFVLKPANCYDEIKLLVGNASEYVYRFVDYLFAEMAKRECSSKGVGNRNWKIEINDRKLARTLRMDAWERNRKWKQIHNSLQNCYGVAKELGYLKSFETVEGVTASKEVLVLNPEKFKWTQEVKLGRTDAQQIEQASGV